MQLKLLSFAVFSFALLARANSSYEEEYLYDREWEGDIIERDPKGGHPVYNGEQPPAQLSGNGRHKAEVRARDLTTRELLDELSDRLWEARGVPSSKVGGRKGKSAARPGKGKKTSKQSPLMKPTFTPEQNAECRRVRGYDCNQRGARIMGPTQPGANPGYGNIPVPEGMKLDATRLFAQQAQKKDGKGSSWA